MQLDTAGRDTPVAALILRTLSSVTACSSMICLNAFMPILFWANWCISLPLWSGEDTSLGRSGQHGVAGMVGMGGSFGSERKSFRPIPATLSGVPTQNSKFASEYPAALRRNRWQPWIGMPDRFGPEYSLSVGILLMEFISL